MKNTVLQLLTLALIFFLLGWQKAHAQTAMISDGPLYDYGLRSLKSSNVHTFTLTNLSKVNARLVARMPLPLPFSKDGGSCNSGLVLPPLGICTVVVAFSPTVPGSFSSFVAYEIEFEDRDRTRSLISRPIQGDGSTNELTQNIISMLSVK